MIAILARAAAPLAVCDTRLLIAATAAGSMCPSIFAKIAASASSYVLCAPPGKMDADGASSSDDGLYCGPLRFAAREDAPDDVASESAVSSDVGAATPASSSSAKVGR